MTLERFDLRNEEGDSEFRHPVGPPSWTEQAACASSGQLLEEFFAEEMSNGQQTEQTLRAKRMCATCNVRPQCLTYQLDWEQGQEFRSGVFGGLSETERTFAAQADDPISFGLNLLDRQVTMGLVILRIDRWKEEDARTSSDSI